MVSSWRKSNREDTTSLLKKNHYSSSARKQGGGSNVFGSFRKSQQYERTPPVTPDEKYDVAIFASEYDPSHPYGMSVTPAAPKEVKRYPSTSIRKVEFKEWYAPAPFHERTTTNPVNSEAPAPVQERSATPVASNASAMGAGTPSYSCSMTTTDEPSVFTRTLGFIDDICQVPKPKDCEIATNGDTHSSRHEWGTVPSQDDESTFPSLQSTENGALSNADYSKSLMSHNSPEVDLYGAVSPPPELEESPSQDHENFEVVLDSTLLQSSASPKRKSWFSKHADEEEALFQQAEEPLAAQAQKSPERKQTLVRRLFSVRKKKDKELAKENVVQEPEPEPEPEPELEPEDPEEEMQARARHPYSARDKHFESSPQISHVRSAPPATSGSRTDLPSRDPPVNSAQEAPTQLSMADEVLSTLGSFLSSLDPTGHGGMPEEEKKEDDHSQTLQQLESIKLYGDDIGPDDETEDNITPVHEMPAPEILRPRAKSADAAEKKEKGTKRTLSLGVLAKKITKPFVKKNDTPEESLARNVAASNSNDAGGDEAPDAPKTKKKSKKDKPLWKTAVDPASGRTYWYNRVTRVSTYDPPPEALAQATEPKVNVVPFTRSFTPRKKDVKKPKPMWKAVEDKNSGRTYYYHRKTRETTWVMPEELKLLEEQKAREQDTAALHKNEPAGDAVTEKEGSSPALDAKDKGNEFTEEQVIPPLVVEAAMTEESQARIHKGEQGLLGTSFEEPHDEDHPSDPAASGIKFDPIGDKKKEIQRLLNSLTPPDPSSVEDLIKEYDGREDLLLRQLREKVEAKPFDEPVVDMDEVPRGTPPRMNGRTTTFLSKGSSNTKSSTITDKTERIRNVGGGNYRFDPISETMSTGTSISSHKVDGTPPRSNSLNRPVHRERELKVEELTGSRVAAETFDKPGRVLRTRGPQHPTDEVEEGSYYGDNEVDTYGTDSVSALSENDADFSHRKENFEQARRRALDDAIEREDWDLAAALSEGMRATNTVGDYAKAHSSWNQSDLDKFIANNDWDAVKSYIAKMRNAKKEGHDVAPPPITKTRSAASDGVVRAPSRNNAPPPPEVEQSQSFSKAVGAKSQLQHKTFRSDSSWTSDSYDSEEEEEEEESYDSEYS